MVSHKALIDGTLFVVFSMPHNESGFKGPTNGTLKVWICSFVYM